MVAVLMVALATSCNNQVEGEQDGTIRFGTKTITTTRGAITSDGDLQQASQNGGEHIGVFGSVSNAQTPVPAEIFTNEPLYYDGADWVYDNTRYWVWGANHQFLAIHPRKSDAYTWNATTGVLNWNDITLGTSNNVDVMWAAASRNLVTNPDTTTPVVLPLKHAFALLEFWFVNASSGVVTSVTDISLENLYYVGSLECSTAGTSTLDVEATKAGSGVYVGHLTNTNIAVNLSQYYNLFDNMGETNTGVYDDIDDITYNNTGTVVVMPQDLYGANVTFKLSTSGTEKTLNLSTLGSVDEWKAGNKYIYTLTLTTQDITFDVRVVDWVDDQIEL